MSCASTCGRTCRRLSGRRFLMAAAWMDLDEAGTGSRQVRRRLEPDTVPEQAASQTGQAGTAATQGRGGGRGGKGSKGKGKGKGEGLEEFVVTLAKLTLANSQEIRDVVSVTMRTYVKMAAEDDWISTLAKESG